MVDNLNFSKIKKVVLWIIDKQNYLLIAIGSIIVVTTLCIKFSPFVKNKTSLDFSAANDCYNSWEKTSYLDNEKLGNLKNYLNKNKFLKPKYDGLITQNLILKDILSNVDETYAFSSLDRTKNEIPYLYEYSNISILISKNEYVKALTNSLDLKKELIKDSKFNKDVNILYPLNLLRIAFLHEKLNQYKEALFTFEEIEKFLKDENVSKNNLEEIFKENNLELIDFIHFKKEKISSY